MTRTASLMPDDALPPDSFVGGMLNPLKDETGSGDVIFVAEPEPLPLWRVMELAHAQDTGSLYATDGTIVFGQPDRDTWAAEIEALRDWLLPEEPEPPSVACNASCETWLERGALRQRQRLRALLTEQARIARGDSNG